MASERIQRRIDRLLDQAEEAMDQMDWTSVRDCAQAVLADPATPARLRQPLGGDEGRRVARPARENYLEASK